MKLYQLSEEYQNAVNHLTLLQEEGEIDKETLDDSLAAIQGDLEEKLTNTALHIKNLRSDCEQLKAEAKKFMDRADKAKKSIEFFESYIDTHMKKSNLEEVIAAQAHIKYKKLPPVVEITGDIPEEYERVVPESRQPDKVKIKKSLSKGVGVNGAELIKGRTKLVIE